MMGVNVQFLKAKKRLILIFDDERALYISALFDPKNISDDQRFVRFGSHLTDQITGYYNINEIANCVVSILKEFE